MKLLKNGNPPPYTNKYVKQLKPLFTQEEINLGIAEREETLEIIETRPLKESIKRVLNMLDIALSRIKIFKKSIRKMSQEEFRKRFLIK